MLPSFHDLLEIIKYDYSIKKKVYLNKSILEIIKSFYNLDLTSYKLLQMSKFQAQINSYLSNDTTYRRLMNFYRTTKTLTLLNHLYTSDAIPQSVFKEQSNQLTQKLTLLRKQLQGIDLKRFCDLWEIQYSEKLVLFDPNSKVVPVYVVKISTEIARINDALSQATNYGQIHQQIVLFCREIQHLRKDKNYTSDMEKIVNDLTEIEQKMKAYYSSLSILLLTEHKHRLEELLVKFRVEFQRIYGL